ncbi:TIGR04141 family sporadically distributed protein [Candidatus Saccharibacteria bacterium]|nr:TIGR04141 family sporadically distributed protein [Candidatus Saccharibacteria bacterium]
MNKRSNNAIWKIAAVEGLSSSQRLEAILRGHQERVGQSGGMLPDLEELTLQDQNQGIRIFRRKREARGLFAFIEDVLAPPHDRVEDFKYFPQDICIFIEAKHGLYVITSGMGYHVIEDYVDYNFPFDVAKKIVANRITHSQTRNLTGSSLSTDERYRGYKHILKSEVTAKVWKNLAGKLNSSVIPPNNPLLEIIDIEKPPTAEIKSSFTLRKSLSLADTVRLVGALDELPAPTEEQKTAMAFLDCLMPVKSKADKNKLKQHLIQVVLDAARMSHPLDYDVCDYKSFERLYAGSDFKVDNVSLGVDDPPGIADIMGAIEGVVEGMDDEAARIRISRMKLTYVDQGTETPVALSLLKALNGQIDMGSRAYFHVDGVFYFASTDFMQNVLSDFVNACFGDGGICVEQAIHGLREWTRGEDEDRYNEEQSRQDDFMLGHKVFVGGQSRIEPFDLLRVDRANKLVYLYHVKRGFDAEFRDLCGQIRMAHDFLSSMTDSDLKDYSANLRDRVLPDGTRPNGDVSEDDFMEWMKVGGGYKKVFVLTCVTSREFTRSTLTDRRVFPALIPRYEVLLTHSELNSRGADIQIVHIQELADE